MIDCKVEKWINYFGIIKYEYIDGYGYKAVVELDKNFGKYYYSLIPKYLNVKPQKYSSHISFVRKEIPLNLEFWCKYQGKKIDFQYNINMKNSKNYYWFDVVSKELENIRFELGLNTPPLYPDEMPKDYKNMFHITIGNLKKLNGN